MNTTATKKGKHESVFQSSKGDIFVTHYCNTHWNPPNHLYKSQNHHSIEWHSPLLCPPHALTYEKPCYVYDPKGKLIDLTHWILSDGGSYEVDLSQVRSSSPSIKQFYLNICNEAHDQCGPNVAACLDDKNGRTESGYLNLTTIKYDSETKNVLVTSLGQHDGTCSDKTVKTVVKFVCNDRPGQKTGPKLVKSSSCEHEIEWKTIHACPTAETRVPATSCSIKYEPLNINLNLKELTNTTSIEIPDIEHMDKKHKVLISLCSGIKPTNFACEGRKSSQASACLIETPSPEAKTTSKDTKRNSTIIGSITQSFIKLTDDRLHLELFAANKTCISDVEGKNFSSGRQLGTRVEFYCSPIDGKPTYLGYDDCTFVFQWGLRAMCLEYFGGSFAHMIPSSSPKPKPAVPVDEKPRVISLDEKRDKSAPELHEATHEDSVKMMEQDSSKATPQPSGSSTATSSKSSTTSSTTTTEAPHVLRKKIEPAMNSYHKYFMISLIIMMLAGFIIVILVLDRRTRIRSPMGNLRRRVHQVFQPAPVPYTQVDRFNDSLDL